MLTSKIKAKAMQLGFLACGVIPAAEVCEYTRHLDARVSTFPESEEYYQHLYALAQLPDTAKSVVVCTQRYTRYKVPDSLSGRIGVSYMFDARVTYSHDYRIRAEFETFMKTLGLNVLKVPVPARLVAAKAGLGKYGRNTFIYDPEHGSYIWIEALVVDKELEYDVAEGSIFLPACSDECERCIKACPTKALSASFSMDRGRCVNQLTCNVNKDIPDENTRTQMGSWLYGCDVCQNVCPANKDKLTGSEEFPLLEEFEEFLTPQRVLEMDNDTYTNVVNPRFWYNGEDGLWLWKCNALRAMINSGDKKYHDLIRKYCDHDDARIRETARWGCGKL